MRRTTAQKPRVEHDAAIAERPSAATYHARANFYRKYPFGTDSTAPRKSPLPDAKRATELEPATSYAFATYAEQLHLAKRLPEAMTAITRSLELKQNDGRLRWAKARILRETGETGPAISEALASLEIALASDAEFAEFLFEKLQRVGYLDDQAVRSTWHGCGHRRHYGMHA